MNDDRPTQAPSIAALDGAVFDAVVVGAGPAGAVAAALLAARRSRVLLVEKSTWPRGKVCGGCLNATAVKTLRDAGLTSALRASLPLDRAIWRIGSCSHTVAAPGGAAILRNDLDALLVDAAVQRGCGFVSETSATLGGGAEHRIVHLRQRGAAARVHASMVLACDGLGGTSLANESWAAWNFARRRPWIGVSLASPLPAAPIPSGAVCMHVGAGGYVGLVRLADGRAHLAAALDPDASQRGGGPAALIASILHAAGGIDLPALADARWHGVGKITRWRRQLGGHRVLALGDACGYFEPFTGEGIGWAIAGAAAAVELLPAPGADWPASLPWQWKQVHAALLRRGRLWRRMMAPAIRRPRIAASALRLARRIPTLADIAARQFTMGELA